MTNSLEQILLQSWSRLSDQLAQFLPNVLAMLLILVTGWVLARLIQWLLERTSVRLERSLRRLGVSSSGGTAHLCARGVFWLIFGFAVLLGINSLDTPLGSQLVAAAVLYLPRLATAGLLVLAGLWLGRFLARGVLIWAVNEGIGPARWLASAVRAGVGLLTVVAAAEQLNVARAATLAVLIIVLSGGVLAAALAFGLGCRKRVEQWLDQRAAFLEGGRDEARIEHL
jgi:hypothetical protein